MTADGTVMNAASVTADDEIYVEGAWRDVIAAEYDAEGSPEVLITTSDGQDFPFTETDPVKVR